MNNVLINITQDSNNRGSQNNGVSYQIPVQRVNRTAIGSEANAACHEWDLTQHVKQMKMATMAMDTTIKMK